VGLERPSFFFRCLCYASSCHPQCSVPLYSHVLLIFPPAACWTQLSLCCLSSLAHVFPCHAVPNKTLPFFLQKVRLRGSPSTICDSSPPPFLVGQPSRVRIHLFSSLSFIKHGLSLSALVAQRWLPLLRRLRFTWRRLPGVCLDVLYLYVCNHGCYLLLFSSFRCVDLSRPTGASPYKCQIPSAASRHLKP